MTCFRRQDSWDEASGSLDDAGRYRRLIGKLIYLTMTRPDIAYTIGLLSQFTHEPRHIHWQGALCVLAYVNNNPSRGLISRKNSHLRVEAYSDSSYADNKKDRKSTSGYCTYVGGNLVTWRSKKQNIVSRSSAEAEYRSMAQTACEMAWLRSLLTELGFVVETPMSMYCDNPSFHERTKHIEVDYHYVRDLVQSGVITTPYRQFSEQLADIFIKGLRAGLSVTSWEWLIYMLQLEGKCELC